MSAVVCKDSSEENRQLKQQVADQNVEIQLLKAEIKYLREIAEISKGAGNCTDR